LGSTASVDRVLDHIRSLPGCADIEIKFSAAETMPFHRMKVRLKREIVTMGEPDIDPLAGVGHYVAPKDWNTLIDDPETIVIDTRNFPAWFRARRAQFERDGKSPRIAMFCTGGIRCEKSTAFLRAEGIDDVHHLRGGILAYLEHVPAKESRWQGECFVFDERVSVGHGLVPGPHSLCRACRMPLGEAERASPHYSEGVSCPYCAEVRSDEDRARYAERQRQEELAARRGTEHVGARFDAPD
jgi:UPF0176 protein